MALFHHIEGRTRGGRFPEVAQPAEKWHPDPLPKVSIIVACYGALHYTQGLYKSLQRNAGTRYELILVDNGCPEGTADWAESVGIRCVRMGENAGVPRAYNAGVAAADTELLALWNNDMLCLKGGLRRLAEACYERGIASQDAGCWNWKGEYVGGTDVACWGDYAGGYSLVFRREVWDAAGEWDPIFFPSYSDDVCWCLRARLAGYDFRLVPKCVTHFGQATSGKMALEGRINLSETARRHEAIVTERYLKYGLGQRILVKRWGAAGDVIMTTPVLRAIKRAAPLARVHVLCHPNLRYLLAGLTTVDGFADESFSPAAYSRIIDLDDAYEKKQRRARPFWEHPVAAYCRVAGVEFDGGGYDLVIPGAVQGWAAAFWDERCS